MKDKDSAFLLGVVLLAPVSPDLVNVVAGSLYLALYLFLSVRG